MAWARVMRGMSSIANAVTRRAASLSIASALFAGARKPIQTAPSRGRSASWPPAV